MIFTTTLMGNYKAPKHDTITSSGSERRLTIKRSRVRTLAPDSRWIIYCWKIVQINVERGRGWPIKNNTLVVVGNEQSKQVEKIEKNFWQRALLGVRHFSENNFLPSIKSVGFQKTFFCNYQRHRRRRRHGYTDIWDGEMNSRTLGTYPWSS